MLPGRSYLAAMPGEQLGFSCCWAVNRDYLLGSCAEKCGVVFPTMAPKRQAWMAWTTLSGAVSGTMQHLRLHKVTVYG